MVEVVWEASCCFCGGHMSSRQQNVCQENALMAVSILLAYCFPSPATKCAWKENSYQCLHLTGGETRHGAVKWLSQSHPPGRWQGWDWIKSPPSLFSGLSAFSPLSLPKYFCSSPFPISLTLSQNKQRVVLKHSTVHLVGTRIRTKLQIKQSHCAYWHSPCGFSWINLFVSPRKHYCEWL